LRLFLPKNQNYAVVVELLVDELVVLVEVEVVEDVVEEEEVEVLVEVLVEVDELEVVVNVKLVMNKSLS